jgi:hypothetical protein
MGFVNKNYPLTMRVAASKRQKEEKNELIKLSEFAFLQEITAFAGRIHTEDHNHRQEND